MNNKIFLIAQREYATRVRKKSFIVMSILGPVLLLLLMVVPIWLASLGADHITVEIVDESGLFRGKFANTEKITFVYTNISLTEAKTELEKNKYEGILYIPNLELTNPQGITYFSDKSLSITSELNISRTISREIEEIRLAQLGIRKELLDSVKTKITLKTVQVGEDGEKSSSSGVATAVGYFGATLIYMFIFMYGTQVLRGVVEEKSNRIVEVLISSVKPFELMMGKILGIAAVALTQFLIWIVLSTTLSTAFNTAYKMDRFDNNEIETTLSQMENQADIKKATEIHQVYSSLKSLNIPLLVGAFCFFFLGSYLLYASLFAIIGAAIDNEADSQQLVLPITIPLIIAITLLSVVIQNPNGNIAFWASLVPFTSPVIMIARLPFGVPMWELLLSMALLIITFIGTTWVAGRVYRIGILMYGKRATFKELSKWAFYKL